MSQPRSDSETATAASSVEHEHGLIARVPIDVFENYAAHRSEGLCNRGKEPRDPVDDAVLCRGLRYRVCVCTREGWPGATGRCGGYSLDSDTLRRHAGFGANVRARTLCRDAQSITAGACASPGAVRREAARNSLFAS